MLEKLKETEKYTENDAARPLYRRPPVFSAPCCYACLHSGLPSIDALPDTLARDRAATHDGIVMCMLCNHYCKI